MNNLKENIRSALRALRENWLRSALTMLGMIIGVGSVVLLISIGQGVKADVENQINSVGANTLFIIPGKPDRSGNPNMMSTLGISTLTDRDVADVGSVNGVIRSVPLMFVSGTVDRNKESFPALVVASTTTFQDVRPHPCVEGRFFREEEENERLAVLAFDPKTDIFGDKPAVGKSIFLKDVEYKVIGVLAREEESMFSMGSFGNMIILPLESTRKALKGGQINRILVKTDFKQEPGPIIEAVKQTLLRNHSGREDFAVLTQKQLLSTITKLFNIVQALVVGIGSISLIVAGIGIMNIMLVTVTERTREIGVRKTVGARQQDIFLQFMTEAIVLAFVGGVIGTLLAVGVCYFVGLYTPLKPLITVGAISLAFGVCFLVGIIFGVAPAMRAARQDPIQALRWE